MYNYSPSTIGLVHLKCKHLFEFDWVVDYTNIDINVWIKWLTVRMRRCQIKISIIRWSDSRDAYNNQCNSCCMYGVNLACSMLYN